jgi:DNA-binding response OmpR family regulator
MRVAVLQTDPQHRYIIGEIVERLGHTCLPFGDGLAMSKALSRSTVDMLILDWNTGALSGLDILKSLRSVGGERLPVLFASADISEGNAVRALSAGADDYVRHPVSGAELSARVEALLRRAYPRNASST